MRAWRALDCGPTARWREVSRDPSQSRVFQVSEGRACHYVKVHRTLGKYRRERDGLRRLAGLDLAPELLDCRDDVRAMVIAPCPGLEPQNPADWRAAGEALARLHAVPCPVDPLPLDAAVRRRLDGWRTRARSHLEPAVIDGLAARVADGAPFADRARVFCHRDYAPRNWRIAHGRCRFFDLEHAGPDAAEVDVVRLFEGRADDDPALTAFFEGYGARPDPARLGALLALHALGTATWGRLHDDRAYIERGDRLIARLLAPQTG